MEKETETLYKKVGRKYVPVSARWYEDRYFEQMDVGTFRLTYAYKNGARAYQYQVKPDTASVKAAMMISRKAMEDKIVERSAMRPQTQKPYTKKQLEIIDKFKKDMGGMYPRWWTVSSAAEISQTAIDAVMDYRP